MFIFNRDEGLSMSNVSNKTEDQLADISASDAALILAIENPAKFLRPVNINTRPITPLTLVPTGTS